MPKRIYSFMRQGMIDEEDAVPEGRVPVTLKWTVVFNVWFMNVSQVKALIAALQAWVDSQPEGS